MKGKFLRVKCKCGAEQTLYSHVTSPVDCAACHTRLAETSGGKAILFCKITKEVD